MPLSVLLQNFTRCKLRTLMFRFFIVFVFGRDHHSSIAYHFHFQFSNSTNAIRTQMKYFILFNKGWKKNRLRVKHITKTTLEHKLKIVKMRLSTRWKCYDLSLLEWAGNTASYTILNCWPGFFDWFSDIVWCCVLMFRLNIYTWKIKMQRFAVNRSTVAHG